MKDPHSIILYPLATEKAVKMIESENKLIFVVDNLATKSEIRKAVEALFEVKVSKVSVEVTPDGKKRAYVKLAPEFMADEIAAKMGMI
ncbi:MAG: 50S ribosomal protein L23 [Candidatus Hadarchaeaceae archaeon]